MQQRVQRAVLTHIQHSEAALQTQAKQATAHKTTAFSACDVRVVCN